MYSSNRFRCFAIVAMFSLLSFHVPTSAAATIDPIPLDDEMAIFAHGTPTFDPSTGLVTFVGSVIGVQFHGQVISTTDPLVGPNSILSMTSHFSGTGLIDLDTLDRTGVFTDDTLSITLDGILVYQEHALRLEWFAEYIGQNSVMNDWIGPLAARPFFNLAAANSPFLTEYSQAAGDSGTRILKWENGKWVDGGPDPARETPEPQFPMVLALGMLAVLVVRRSKTAR